MTTPRLYRYRNNEIDWNWIWQTRKFHPHREIINSKFYSDIDILNSLEMDEGDRIYIKLIRYKIIRLLENHRKKKIIEILHKGKISRDIRDIIILYL